MYFYTVTASLLWKLSMTLSYRKLPQYSSCHVNLSASGIYFGSPFGYYPTFHTLTSVGRKQYFQYVKRMFPLFRAIVKFCSTNRLFTENCSTVLELGAKITTDVIPDFYSLQFLSLTKPYYCFIFKCD